MKPTRYAEIAAVIFAAGSAFAVVHGLVGANYGHFAYPLSVAIDVGLAGIWWAAAVASLVRRSFAAFLAILIGALAAHIHGLVFSVAAAGKGYGVPFLIASAVLPLLFALSAPAWRTTAPATADSRNAARASLSQPSHA